MNRLSRLVVLCSRARTGSINRAIVAAMEPFELRRMLAAAPITVNGTSNPDVISITASGATLTVNNNGASTSHVLADVSFINVNALAGADSVMLGDGVPPSLIHGGTGNDTLIGGSENDSIFGDDNDDQIDGRGGGDYMSGGSGIDTLDYRARTAGVSVSLDSIKDDGDPGELDNALNDNEYIFGGSGNDLLKGHDGENALFGYGGNDTLIALGGRDALWGGDGDDLFEDGDGDDLVVGEAGNDGFRVGLGNDQFFGNGTNPEAPGGRETIYFDTMSYAARTAPINVNMSGNDIASIDRRSGQDGELDRFDPTIDAIIGGSGDDEFYIVAQPLATATGHITFDGRGGQDDFFSEQYDTSKLLFVKLLAYGGTGDDGFFGSPDASSLVAIGGEGNDTYHPDSPSVSFNGGPGVDWIDMRGLTVPGTHVIDLRGTEIENVDGSPFTDIIYGNESDNYLFANSGNDTIYGLGGNDTIMGVVADDSVVGIELNNFFDGGEGNDSILGGDGDDLLFDGDGDDVMVGGDGNDGFRVGLGNDRIFGGIENPESTGGREAIYFDTISYAARTERIDVEIRDAVAPASARTAGQSGEIDQFDANIDAIVGGSGDDEFFVVASPFVSSTGHLTFDGRGGNDGFWDLEPSNSTTFVSVLAYGSAGDDSFHGHTIGSSSFVGMGDDGNDLFVPTRDSFTFFGGEGIDLLSMVGETEAATHTIDLRGTGIENATGSSAARDLIYGNELNNQLYGYGAHDTLIGLGGNDSLYGSEGMDLLIGGEGDDLLDGMQDRDILIGGAGADQLQGNEYDDVLLGGDTSASQAAVFGLTQIWSDFSRSYEDRVAQLLASPALNSASLVDDLATDTLQGSAGRDLFFQGDNDILDNVAGESVVAY